MVKPILYGKLETYTKLDLYTRLGVFWRNPFSGKTASPDAVKRNNLVAADLETHSMDTNRYGRWGMAPGKGFTCSWTPKDTL